jgi:glycosyltransferase involved in cell wall biosynthesis
VPKVLRVITRLNVGGPSKQISTLNAIFKGESFDQLLITGRVLDSEKEIELNQFSNLIKLSRLQRELQPFNDLYCIFRIAAEIRRYNPDIIHTHLSKAWALTVIAKMLSGRKAKVVHTFHGHILHSYFPKWKTILINLFQRFLASKTDVLVAVNEITKDELLESHIGLESSFHVINPGFKPAIQESLEVARLKLKIHEEFFTIGFVGRFEAIKRPDLLAQIINSVNLRFRNVQFLICGGGSLYDVFKKDVAAPNVYCLPWVEDLSPIYSSLNLMILTSDNEGSPLTIVEAGQLGVPTLSRPVGGVPRLILDSKTGFLTTEEPDDYVTVIDFLMSHPSVLSEVSINTKEHFQLNYGEEIFLRKYSDLYLELMA